MRSSSRRVLPVVLALLCTTGLAASAAQRGGPPRGIDALTDGSALRTALDLETRLTDSLQSDQVVPVVFDSPEQLAGHVVSAPYWGDTALWSGVYLGAEAFRYAVASKHLGHGDDQHEEGDADSQAGVDEPSFSWQAQRMQALARIAALVRGEHRNVAIAEDWQPAMKIPPAVNTTNPRGPHTADFGGGIVPGQRGMIMRACTRVGLGPLGITPPNVDPANPVNDNSNTVYEITWSHGDGQRYNCYTAPTRDTYAGMVFGMLTAFDLVGPDEPLLRHQIRDDLLAMGDFLVKYQWTAPRANGIVGTNHQDDNFIFPLFNASPIGRLNVAAAVRHVVDVDGSPADQRRWDAIWATEIASQGPLVGAQAQIDATTNHHEGYYGLNLDHLNAFDLLRVLTGPERDLVARGFAAEDASTRTDANAHFESLMYAVTGDIPRRSDAVTHLLQWQSYRATVESGAAVTNSARCGRDLHCVPKDQIDIATGAGPSTVTYPGSPQAPPFSQSAGPRADGPLPVAQRPPTDFLWQAPSTELDGQRDRAAREPGIDFLEPYWLLRYLTEVATPQAQPLPAWVGLTTR